MYDKIFEFCSIKNIGGAFRNGQNMSPRVVWLVKFIHSLGIEFEVDEFQIPRGGDNKFYNIVMKGSKSIAVTAHHDIVNPRSDNANDNSCSVINAIMIKKLSPQTTVILLDGEECGGIGAQRASDQILEGKYGNISSVLNLELTGKGGKYFFIGECSSPFGNLNNKILSIFDPPVVSVPFNDSVIFRRNGIDATVINPAPPLEEEDGEDDFNIEDEFMRFTKPRSRRVVFNDGTPLDMSILYNCHSIQDSLSTIDPKDMKEFVEEVVLKII